MESLVVEGNVLQVVLAKLAVLIANTLKEFQFINSQIQVWKKKGIKMGQVCDETGFQGLEDFCTLFCTLCEEECFHYRRDVADQLGIRRSLVEGTVPSKDVAGGEEPADPDH